MIQNIARNWRYFIPFRKRIGYIGWLGYENLGDEAMYYAFKKLYKNFNVLPFKHTYKIRLYESITSRKIYNSVFLGGGTFINSDGSSLRNLKIAQQRYKGIYIWGSGVRNPCFWEDIHRYKNCFTEWADLLNKCQYVGVRGPLSKQLLDCNGYLNSEILGDPALSLSRNVIIRKRKMKKLGINIGISNGYVWGNEGEILDFVVEFAALMIQKGWKVTFLPVWSKDLAYIEEAVSKLNGKADIFYQYSSITSTLDFLQGCDIFVGEKLHSVILAMCAYTPSVMLEYRPKCLDFMASMGLERFNMRTDRLSMYKLLDNLEELSSKSDVFQDEMSSKILFYKNRQRERAMSISRDIIRQEKG